MTSDLAATAARSALSRAGVAGDSVDLLILATATPDRQAPATACLTQQKAGLARAVAFDISAVCSGFLFALTTAAAFLASGQAKRALVVGADTFSRVTDWSRRDCVFFGDGAGATLIERAPARRDALFDSVLYTDGSQCDAFTIGKSQRAFTMDAQGVFRNAMRAVPLCIDEVVRRNGLTAGDVDIVIPHQPSISLLRDIASRVDVPFRKFRTNMQGYANTAGATIPIMLHETLEKDEIRKGDTVLFAAAGAGFTAGAALHRWQ